MNSSLSANANNLFSVSQHSSRQPWLISAKVDLFGIIGPAYIASIIAITLFYAFPHVSQLSPWAWLGLVVGIDVAHVYSTLFRTYFSAEGRKRYKLWLIAIPLLSLTALLVVQWLAPQLFWTVLAYVAVFHFIRQQYGFFTLYSRNDIPTEPNLGKFQQIQRNVSQGVIYFATLYPILYWHSHLPRAFNWFTPSDFIVGLPVWVADAAGVLYAILGIIYGVNEFKLWRKTGAFNLPKNLLLIGTALSWGLGIVVLNNDIVFTLTNIIAHGIPYMTLIWYLNGRPQTGFKTRRSFLPIIQSLALFLGILILFAFIEEALWDTWVWKEHAMLFLGVKHVLQHIHWDTPPVNTLWILIPILATPQLTHYLLDGIIWRRIP
jgi:hypothetical protein